MLYELNTKTLLRKNQCETGGKPSTRLPPGKLVEHFFFINPNLDAFCFFLSFIYFGCTTLSLQPRASSSPQPQASRSQPPASKLQHPASNVKAMHKPGASSLQPSASGLGLQPPALGLQLSASSLKQRCLSFTLRLFKRNHSSRLEKHPATHRQ